MLTARPLFIGAIKVKALFLVQLDVSRATILSGCWSKSGAANPRLGDNPSTWICKRYAVSSEDPVTSHYHGVPFT